MPVRKTFCSYCLKPIGNNKQCFVVEDKYTMCLKHDPRKVDVECPGCKKEVNIFNKHVFSGGRVYHEKCVKSDGTLNPFEFTPERVNINVFSASLMSLIPTIAIAIPTGAATFGIGHAIGAGLAVAETGGVIASVLPAFGDKGEELASQVKKVSAQIKSGTEITQEYQKTGKVSASQIQRAVKLAEEVSGLKMHLTVSQTKMFSEMIEAGKVDPSQIAKELGVPLAEIKQITDQIKIQNPNIFTKVGGKMAGAGKSIKDATTRQLIKIIEKTKPKKNYLTRDSYETLIGRFPGFVKKTYNAFPKRMKDIGYEICKYVIDRVGAVMETGGEAFSAVVKRIGVRNPEDEIRTAWEELTQSERESISKKYLKKSDAPPDWSELSLTERKKIGKLVGVKVKALKPFQAGKGAYFEISFILSDQFQPKGMLSRGGEVADFLSKPLGLPGGMIITIGKLKGDVKKYMKEKHVGLGEALMRTSTVTQRILLPTEHLEVDHFGHLVGITKRGEREVDEVNDIMNRMGAKYPLVHIEGGIFKPSKLQNPAIVEKHINDIDAFIERADAVGLILTAEHLKTHFKDVLNIPEDEWDEIIVKIQKQTNGRHGE